MGVEFCFNDNNYRFMFKYGWYHTNSNLDLPRGRRLTRDLMLEAITKSETSYPKGDLHFSPSIEKEASFKFNWRMCSVFIVKLVDDHRSEIVCGPFTSVCVPGDQFTYEAARDHAIWSIKDYTLREYYAHKSRNLPYPSLFLFMEGFKAWVSRKRKKPCN